MVLLNYLPVILISLGLIIYFHTLNKACKRFKESEIKCQKAKSGIFFETFLKSTASLALWIFLSVISASHISNAYNTGKAKPFKEPEEFVFEGSQDMKNIQLKPKEGSEIEGDFNKKFNYMNEVDSILSK